LLVITLMVVIVSVVVKQGLGSLHQAKLTTASKQGLFAAEAGAADAFRQLVEDPSWAGPLPETPMQGGALYWAEVTNNLTGSGEQTASNGARVPPGFAYILASGRPSPQGVLRRVGVLVSPGSLSALSMVIGVGGQVDMQGGKDIGGSIKANGNISFQGSTNIAPVNGSGRVLGSANVSFQGSSDMDEAQDVRARGTVSASPSVGGAYLVQSNDVSDSSLPFINDYRTNNALLAGEQGQVLPNPDPALLLAGAVVHTDPVGVSPFDTGGMVHHFPNGLSFSGSSQITGGGTIVVTGGNAISFQGSTNVDANLIALRDLAQQPSGGNPTITFQGSATIEGFVYAHQGVHFQGSTDLDGLVVAYGGDLTSQGSTNIQLNSTVLADIPGFNAWASGFGGEGGIPAGSGPISVRSWERQ
jgi:hypothetical protein